MTVDARRSRPATAGSNVVGYLPGDAPGPIVVGAHHDGWFRAAFDNATGVAALLGIARALRSAGHRPAPPDLLHLAHRRGVRAARPRVRLVRRRVAAGERTHPEWGERVAVPPLPRGERPPGPAAGARGAGRADALGPRRRQGRRGGGLADVRLARGPPVTGTEQWPLLVAGVPGVAAYNWETSFAETIYHTPLDTPEIVDFDQLERLTRFYAYLLLDGRRATRTGSSTTARARASWRSRPASSAPPARRSRAAAERARRRARPRAAFTAVGRALHAVDADGRARATRTSRRPPTSRRSRRRSPRSAGDDTRDRREAARQGRRQRARAACSRRRRSRARPRRARHPARRRLVGRAGAT